MRMSDQLVRNHSNISVYSYKASAIATKAFLMCRLMRLLCANFNRLAPAGPQGAGCPAHKPL